MKSFEVFAVHQKNSVPHNTGCGYRRRGPGIHSLFLGFTLTSVLPVYSANADEAAVSNVTELDALVVTARQGEELAKEVPFGLSVLGGEEIEIRRLQDIEDALRSVPGVDVNSSGGVDDPNIRIRGVGSLYSASRDDNSVVLNVDGVSMSSRNLSMGTLDVERIEVLKGPQGTLFGRNSEAGAINVTTRKPTRYNEGYVRGEIGEQNQYLAEGILSGPLSESFSGRFAARTSGSDHWVENARDGDPVSEPREAAFRGSLLWEPGTDTSALLVAERQQARDHVNLILLRPFDDAPSLDLPPATFDENEVTTDRYSVELTHDLPNSRLTSTTAAVTTDIIAWRVYDRQTMEALYGMSTEYLNRDSADERIVSQEVRWSSLPGARTFWITGVHTARSDRSYDSQDTFQDTTSLRDFTTNSVGVYGEITYPLTETLKLTGGLRHSWDRKEYEADYIAGGSTTRDERDLTDHYTTGRAGLSYAVTPSTNIFGIVARGYKSGGFNDFATDRESSQPYKSASVNTAEIGFKTDIVDQHFTLNGSLFFNRVHDDHLLGYDSATLVTSTVNADTETRGAELEGSWRFNGGTTIAAGLSHIDAEITTDVAGASGGDVAAGNRVPDVPRWSGSVSLSHIEELPGFLGLTAPALNSSINYRVAGSRPADAQNSFNLDRYHKLDLRLGLMIGSGEIYAWGDNLLNEQYDLYGFQLAPSVAIGAPARGRTVGVGFNYQF